MSESEEDEYSGPCPESGDVACAMCGVYGCTGNCILAAKKQVIKRRKAVETREIIAEMERLNRVTTERNRAIVQEMLDEQKAETAIEAHLVFRRFSTETRRMKVLCIISCFNEQDIIPWTVRHLKRQGCDVLVIDCESTDGTAELATSAGAVVMSYHAPPVSWHALLGLVEKVAAQSDADWIMHCDADELRYSNFPGKTLAQAFQCVQAYGFNAVDFQVLTFHPTGPLTAPRDAPYPFDGSQDPEQYFRYYSGDPLNQRIGQVKAWRNVGRVSLAASGGHQVQFPGRRVYPVKFLSKHYPIRSQAHGERKVFEERKWLDQSQGRKDWHVQYDGIVPGDSFLKDPKCLMEWK